MSGRTRVKICGVRDAETAWWAAAAGADAVGLVFAAGSPRVVSEDEARAVVRALPALMASVGLFVDASPEEVAETRAAVGFDLAQLHGSEDEALVEETARAAGSRVIKAVRYDEDSIEGELRRWGSVEAVAAVLVDGSAGGAGTAFDWAGLARVMGASGKPVILAGGLDPTNVAEGIRVVQPFAVDVSSGVERERGVKDGARIEAFCRAAASEMR